MCYDTCIVCQWSKCCGVFGDNNRLVDIIGNWKRYEWFGMSKGAKARGQEYGAYIGLSHGYHFPIRAGLNFLFWRICTPCITKLDKIPERIREGRKYKGRRNGENKEKFGKVLSELIDTKSERDFRRTMRELKSKPKLRFRPGFGLDYFDAMDNFQEMKVL